MQSSIYCGLGQINLLQCALVAFTVGTTFCYFFDFFDDEDGDGMAMHGGEKDGHSLPYYPQGRKPKQKTFTGKHVARLCASISQPGPAIHVDGMSGWWRDVLGESGQFQDSGGFVQWEGGELTTDQGTSQWEPTRTLTTGPSSKG